MFLWSRKPKQAPDGSPARRHIERITHSAQTSTLTLEFSDGEVRTHVDVLPGHLVGLRVAADRLDFYESQILPMNAPLEPQRREASSAAAKQGRG
jgi:KTSC domain